MDERIVLQPRCISCDTEHYGPAVFAISHGEARCGNCGLRPPVFTDPAAYAEALRDEDWRGYAGYF